MTSKHLQQNLFNLIASPGAFHAKTLAWPGNNVELPKRHVLDCSTNSSESYAWYDPSTSSWKTWQRCLITEWESFLESFPKLGTMQNGKLLVLGKGERVTFVKESGSLPTPTASDVEGGIAKDTQYSNGSFYRVDKVGKKHNVKLRDAVSIFPTPRARDWKGKTNYKTRGYGASLPDIADQLPTPNTMDHLPQRSPEALKNQMEGPRKGRTKLANLREAVHPETVELFNTMKGLPTPRTSTAMSENLETTQKRKRENGNLEDVIAQTLPTPCTRDHKDSGENVNYQKGAEKGKLSGVLNHTYSTQTGEGTYLSQRFVEEMMGYPLNWTQVNE